MKEKLAFVAAMWLALGTSRAAADVAPPRGYVEQCTLVRAQEATGRTCVECRNWVSAQRESRPCETAHGARGWAKHCQTRGASAWTEIWCEPARGGEAPAAEVAPSTAEAAPEEDEAPAPEAPQTTTTSTMHELEGAAETPPAQTQNDTPAQPQSGGCALHTSRPQGAALPLMGLALLALARRGVTRRR